jgi:DNA-binding response OmpR family regulator
MTPLDTIITRLFPENLTGDKHYRSLIRNMFLAITIVSMVPMILVSSTLYLQFRQSYQEKVNDHVIMLTGHGSEKSASEGMEYGAYDYLFKPYEFEELLEKIRAAVSRTKK